MAARRYTAVEVSEIVMNFPYDDDDESELSDFEGSEPKKLKVRCFICSTIVAVIVVIVAIKISLQTCH